MTIVQRLELHRRGYSKDEINELAQQETAAASAQVTPEQAQEPPAASEVEPAPDAAAPEPAPAASSQPSELAQILETLNALTTAIAQQNIQTREQPPVKKETTSDIFNNILKG